MGRAATETLTGTLLRSFFEPAHRRQGPCRYSFIKKTLSSLCESYFPLTEAIPDCHPRRIESFAQPNLARRSVASIRRIGPTLGPARPTLGPRPADTGPAAGRRWARAGVCSGSSLG